MIVFDLQCSHSHIFEGWFSSSADYEDQQAKGLLACPLCGCKKIQKAVMAPAVAAKGNQQKPKLDESTYKSEGESGTAASNPDGNVPQALTNTASATPLAEMKSALTALAKAQAKALEKSEWVGKDFAETARAMHYGEKETAQVHGEASLEEAKELFEEGVPIAPLPLPTLPDKNKN